MATRNMDLRELDQVRWSAGAALRLSGPSQRTLGNVIGVDQSTISRRMRGVRETGPEAEFFIELRKLTIHPKCSPWPLLSRAFREVASALEEVPTEQLVSEFWMHMDGESEAEGQENVASGRIQREGIAAVRELVDAGLAEMDHELPLLLISTELIRRYDEGQDEADPCHSVWRHKPSVRAS